MFCPFCGKPIYQDEEFCTSCGNKLSDEEVLLVKKHGKKRPPNNVGAGEKAFAKTSAPRVNLDKTKIRNIGYGIFLLILYAFVPVAVFLAVNMEETIKILTKFDSSVEGLIKVKEILELMISGNEMFHPTVGSTLLAVLMYLVMYTIPVLTLITFVGTAMRKKPFLWQTTASFVHILSAALLVTFMPLSLAFVPGLGEVLAAEESIIFADIEKFSYVTLLMLAGAILLSVIVSYVIVVRWNRGDKR